MVVVDDLFWTAVNYNLSIIDRSFVFDQMDPNNISGLLKLHLRENPIISNTLMVEIQDEMNPSSPSEIVSSIKLGYTALHIYSETSLFRTPY